MSAAVIAVPDALKDAAGLMVWWELSGNVDMDDLRDAFESHAWDPGEMPAQPSLELALARAAAAAITTKRQLLRPLSKRGAWEIVQEQPMTGPDGVERNHYTSMLRGWVEKTESGPELRVEGDETLRAATLAKVKFYRNVLTPTDYSAWLLGRAVSLHAVALRQRGGFYFLPKDKIGYWRQIQSITRSCSAHGMFEVPAMRSDEAVEAIISSVRNEALRQVESIEQWLKQETLSTRGLNSSERQADEMKAKLAHYCKLLGQSLPDLEQRLENLTGAIQAARIVQQAEK